MTSENVFRKAQQLLILLAKEMREDRSEGVEADRLRDSLDDIVKNLSTVERQRLNELSADLYLLDDAQKDTIKSMKVVSEPGAAITVTQVELSEEAKKSLTIKGEIPSRSNFEKAESYKPYWENSWKDVVYVPVEELAECCVVKNFDKDQVLNYFYSRGLYLDAYILPSNYDNGYHSIGVRYGNGGPEYLSPYGEQSKVAELLKKYGIPS